MSPSVLRLLIPSQLLWATELLFVQRLSSVSSSSSYETNFLWKFNRLLSTLYRLPWSLTTIRHLPIRSIGTICGPTSCDRRYSPLSSFSLLSGYFWPEPQVLSFRVNIWRRWLPLFLAHYLLSRPSRTCAPTYWILSVPLNHQAVVLSRAPVPSLQSLHLKTDFLHICSFPLDRSFDECRPIVYPKNCTRYMSMFRGVGLFPPLLGQDIFFGLLGGSSLGVFTVQCIIFLFAWIPVRLDIHVPSSTLVLFLGALTGVVQRVLYRGDFLNHCSGVPSHYGPFSFPIAVHFDELIIALGLMFPCLFIDRMFALIRLW